MTPRAIAEPGMNQWLGSILGSTPDKIHCEVGWLEKDEKVTVPPHDPHSVTLADLGIQPIDFVWMVGISPEDTHGATELETRIAFHCRRAHGISDDKIMRIRFNPDVAAGETKFAAGLSAGAASARTASRKQSAQCGRFSSSLGREENGHSSG